MTVSSARVRLNPDKVVVESKIHSAMGKNLFMLGLLSVAALASCSIKEDLQQPEPSPRFYASIEQPASGIATKVYVDDTYHLFWNASDLVTIFYEKTLNRQFMFDGATGDTAGGFDRSDTDPQFGSEQDIEVGFNYAIYPWREKSNNACDTQGNLKVVIPKIQVPYNDDNGIGARALMVARAPKSGGIFYFKHVGSYIGIRLIGDGVSVASISFRGNNSEMLAGRVQVSFGEDGLPRLGPFDSNHAENSDTIMMEFETPVILSKDKATVFWFNVPAIPLSGYTLTVTDPDGGTFEKVRNEPLTLERAYFYDLDATVTITPASIPVTGVTVAPTTLEMTVGDDPVALKATVAPDNASNKNVTWKSSDESVATVDADGKVSAVAAGSATITVTTEDGEKSATCTITVKEKVYPVETVTLDKEALVLFVGEAAVALTATISPDNATNKNVTWTSSDPNVATVDENGNVTAIAVGTATITVKTEDGNKTDECAVTVKAHVASVSLDKTTLEVFVGDDPVALEATVAPDNASNKNVTWKSSDESVATVDADGKVSAVAAGTATITVTTTDGEKTATCTVTVKDVITYSLAIDPDKNAEVNAGSEFTFKLMLTTKTNGVVGEPVNVAANATWTSSDDAFATIANGVAKGVKEGSVTITAKYTTPDDDEKTLTAPLKVNKNPNQAGDDVPIGGGGSFGGN